jgi:hypothetical protein
MEKRSMDKSRGVVVLAGLALIAGFFLPWIDIGGFFQVSGLQMVLHGEGSSTAARVALAALPLVGLALIVAAAGNARAARALGFFVGGGILLYFFGSIAWGFLKTTGVGLWLVLGGSALALVAGLSAARRRDDA